MRARDAGIEGRIVNARDFPDKETCDRAIADILLDSRVELVCLAGFMRIVGKPLLEAFPNRILNIHRFFPPFLDSTLNARRSNTVFVWLARPCTS